MAERRAESVSGKHARLHTIVKKRAASVKDNDGESARPFASRRCARRSAPRSSSSSAPSATCRGRTSRGCSGGAISRCGRRGAGWIAGLPPGLRRLRRGPRPRRRPEAHYGMADESMSWPVVERRPRWARKLTQFSLHTCMTSPRGKGVIDEAPRIFSCATSVWRRAAEPSH